MSNCSEASEENLTEKFFLIVICGSVLSTAGVVFNALLTLSFLIEQHWARTTTLYLLVLAVLDLWLCLLYLPIFAVEILYFYFNSVYLYTSWHYYIPILFPLSRTIHTGATYVLMAATADRYRNISKHGIFHLETSKSEYSPHRMTTVALVMAVSVALRLPMFWELQVENFPNCSHFASLHLTLTDFARAHSYRSIYTFWFQNIFQVIGPFLVLLALNVAILKKLKDAETIRKAFITLLTYGIHTKTEVVNSRGSVKDAAATIVALITSYLACNLLSFLISILDHIDPTLPDLYPRFYTLAVDVVTLLYVLNSAVRIFVYYASNDKIRRNVNSIMRCACREQQVNPELRILLQQLPMPTNYKPPANSFALSE